MKKNQLTLEHQSIPYPRELNEFPRQCEDVPRKSF